MKAKDAYQALSEEQKSILLNKVVDLDRNVDELVDLLKPVAAFDKAVGSSRTRLGCSIGLLIVAVIASFVLMGAVHPLVGGAVLVAAIVGLVYTIKMYKWAGSVDVSDNLGGFALPMLSLLREDFDGAEPVHVHLDLRAPTAKEKVVNVGKEYKRGAYYKIIDTIYKDEWFSGRALLHDGSRLRWELTEIIRESKKSKRTPRGKYKTKTKHKKKAKIEIELTLRKKTYDVSGSAKEKESEKSATVRAEHVFVTNTLTPIPLEPMLDTVTGIYRAAQPAK
jgi:hypothetical protein